MRLRPVTDQVKLFGCKWKKTECFGIMHQLNKGLFYLRVQAVKGLTRGAKLLIQIVIGKEELNGDFHKYSAP